MEQLGWNKVFLSSFGRGRINTTVDFDKGNLAKKVATPLQIGMMRTFNFVALKLLSRLSNLVDFLTMPFLRIFDELISKLNFKHSASLSEEIYGPSLEISSFLFSSSNVFRKCIDQSQFLKSKKVKHPDFCTFRSDLFITSL